MAYWMAFNFLYYNGYEPKKEWQMISKYVIQNKHILEELLAICKNDIDIIVNNKLNNITTKYYENIEKEENVIRLKALFKIFYKIRCNLFHGNKSPYGKKDTLLVSTSENIMEKTLGLLLKIN